MMKNVTEDIDTAEDKRCRWEMVETQIVARGIKDRKVISTMLEIPRHFFVPPQYRKEAYEDHPVPIGYGQTISQPYMVALMTELLDLEPTDKVLEVGTGSGYQAAIIAPNVSAIYTVERIPELVEYAKNNLSKLGGEFNKNIHIFLGDGSAGLKEYAPYDKIIVTAGARVLPKAYIEQLRDGGRLVIPVGGDFGQTLYLIRKEKGKIVEEAVCGCVFVPLITEGKERDG